VTVTAAPLLLDEVLPDYDVHEVHARSVAADPDALFDAVRAVTAGDLRVSGLLIALRGLAGPREVNDRARPLLAAMVARGFAELGERAGEQLVLGLISRPWRPIPVTRPIADAADFAAFTEPGWVRAAIDLRIEPVQDRCRLVTETRVEATDEGARRRFACYWRLIRPGSAVIRRDLLAAIARRAEASA
jgi:hypothetical protein